MVANNVLFSKEIDYTISDADLGPSAVERIVPFQVRLVFTPPDANHPQAEILSNEYSVFVRRQADGGSTVNSGVNLVFVVDEPSSTVAVGNLVKFRLKVATGKYALLGDSFVVQKELYDANGNKIGSAEPAALFGIPYLPTGSTSEDLTQSYALKQEDVDAGHIRFFYRWVIQDHHLFNVDGTAADLNDDFEHVFAREHIMGDLPTATATPTTRVTPTPTPRPRVTLVGSTNAVRVTRVSTNRILFDLTRGQDFNMDIGFIAADGTRGYSRFGYIRDASLGQTYAVVNRESDDRVVRIWIAPDSAERYQVPWDEVNDFWTFPQSIVNAIPLDEMHPADNQLVDFHGDYYVFTAGAWRHIPDIGTFQARNFYWCDMTSADTGWLSRVRIGRPLQSSGTAEIPNYPNCRE